MKSDKIQKRDGKIVKFGTQQLNNPTPEWAKVTFRIILYLSALYVGVIQPILNLPTETILLIDKIIIGGNAFVNVTIKFFGWDNPN